MIGAGGGRPLLLWGLAVSPRKFFLKTQMLNPGFCWLSVEVDILLTFLHWVGIALHPWPFVSDIGIFVLKGDVKLQLTNWLLRSLVGSLGRVYPSKQRAFQGLNQFQNFNFSVVLMPWLFEPKKNKWKLWNNTCCEISCFLKNTVMTLGVATSTMLVPQPKSCGGPVSPGPFICCAYASASLDSWWTSIHSCGTCILASLNHHNHRTVDWDEITVFNAYDK